MSGGEGDGGGVTAKRHGRDYVRHCFNICKNLPDILRETLGHFPAIEATKLDIIL